MNRFSNAGAAAGFMMVAFVALAFVGCGTDRLPFDVSGPFDIADDGAIDIVSDSDSGGTGTSLVILNPAQDQTVISQPVGIVFRYRDDAGAAATVTLSGAGVESVELELDGPGEHSIQFVPVSSHQGLQKLDLGLETVDGQTATASIDVVVDTVPPEIEFLPPTPDSGLIVNDDFVVRVKVRDEGTLVHRVRITAKDFSWEWPTAAAVPVVEVDSSENGDVVIPVSGWKTGIFTIQASAFDGVDGHVSHSVITVGFRGEVEFGNNDTGIPYPPLRGIVGSGIRLGPAAGRVWGSVTADGVFLGSAAGIIRVAEPFGCTFTLWGVFDVNGDGTEDILGQCSGGNDPGIVFALQDASGNFSMVKALAGDFGILDIAAGDLNGDGWADLAFLLADHQALPAVHVSLSRPVEVGEGPVGGGEVTVEDGGTVENAQAPAVVPVAWAPAVPLIGAVEPVGVEIGRFSDNGRNAVLVSSGDMAVLTVFPVDPEGRLLMGENSFFGESPFSIVSSTSLCASGGAPDTVIMASECSLCATVYLAGIDTEGSARVDISMGRTVGTGPVDIESADVNGDGSGDTVVLSRGANMILYFTGGQDCRDRELADGGASLVSGGASHIWISDFDADGYLDIFAVTADSVRVIPFRMDEFGGHFDGSYQVRFELVPRDVEVGRFVSPGSGKASGYLDAAVLTETVQVMASNPVIGQPIDPVSMLQSSKSRIFAGPVTASQGISPGVGNPTGIVVGQYAVRAEGDDISLQSVSSVPLDGFVVTSPRTVTEIDRVSAAMLLLEPLTHEMGKFQFFGLEAGNAPKIAASGNFDGQPEETSVSDVAFVWHRDRTPDLPGMYFLHPWRSNGDGTLAATTVAGYAIDALEIQENRHPVAIHPFRLRQAAGSANAGDPAPIDLIVANGGTSDFTVFTGIGDGRFLAKYDGSLDFAVGLPPVDIAAGYLEAPVDGSEPGFEGEGELPDVVTLTREGNVSVLVVSYSLSAQELVTRGLDVGFEVPLAIPIFQPGSPNPPNPIPYPVAVALADVSGDSMLDILVLDRGRSSVLVFQNRGKRQFSQPYEFFTGTEPVAMKAADVNADGCVDILTVDQKGKTMSVLRNGNCRALPDRVN